VLTRLEVDGFKNLVDFEVDFGPFTCIAGPNAVGKSNLFDVIRFLSLLTDHTLMEAALLVRGSGTETTEIRDLFQPRADDEQRSFRIAAEMIVNAEEKDDFGRPAEATSTYLRYEIQIGYETATEPMPGRLVLLFESLSYITEAEAASRLKFPHSAGGFRKKVVVNKRRTPSGFISSRKAPDGQTEIVVHQDGGSRGPGQVAPAATAPRTIVGTSNTSATPTILAARREMQRWRLLALEPSAMRRPDRFQTDPFVTPNGGHLAATVFRLITEAEQHGENADSVYAGIADRLGDLVPVSNIHIDVDNVRQLLTLQVHEQSGVQLPAASLSDGTLRFLTLAVILADPLAQGLICIEEPENGIHPAKMAEMSRLLRELAVDAEEAPSRENPFRQVVVATHSPYFVQLQEPDDLLFATEASVRKDNRPVRTLRCMPMSGTWRAKNSEVSVGKGAILAYLSSPPGAQIELPLLDSIAR
jgi:predicted ATPase